MALSDQRTRTFAIVPAAGHGRRFGGPKQLALIDGQPMLVKVIRSLDQTCITRTIVVTRDEIAAALRLADQPVQVVVDEAPEMIDSVRLALRWIADNANPTNRDAIVVLPGDHPDVASADIEACIHAYGTDAGRIVIATRDGRRGHPLVFAYELAPIVLSATCDTGLNQLARTHPTDVAHMPCRSPGITRDVDRREDLEA